MTDTDCINEIVYWIAQGHINEAENRIVELAMVDDYDFTMDDANRILAAAEALADDYYDSIRDTLRDNSELTLF